MSAVRAVGIVMTPQEAEEAKGVTIRRTIGSEKLVLLDPFLLLDHLNVPAGGPDTIGFPRHPHRGIETLTYVFSGRVHHRDSLGNDDSIGAHESQWMTAGGGIFHSEMLESGTDGNESLQLWFNMPAAQKMTPPQYSAARAADIPVLNKDGAEIRVVAGTIDGVTGPFQGIAANPLCLDVHLAAGKTITLPTSPEDTAIAYVYRGSALFGDGTGAVAPNLAILCEGDTVLVTAGEEELRFLLVAARPFQEPVLQYRSLVMNTVEQMKEALDDLQNGVFEWGKRQES